MAGSPWLWAAVVLAACSARPATFDCGKLICSADQYCLHFTPADSGTPPDGNHTCVTAPAECDGVPTCDCVDACETDCTVDDGLSCWGQEP